MDFRFEDIFLQAADTSRATERHQQQQSVNLPVDAPTCLDVLNGRGQGLHRHPGNAKYRMLVSFNRGLYAKCPAADKAKISRGIVAAIREFGGRFLKLDERSGTYSDIGDKRAREKTSQALREGLRKIRQKQKLRDGGAASDDFDMSLLATFAGRGRDGAIPEEGYFEHSVRLLESLCERSDEGDPSQAPPGRWCPRGLTPVRELRTTQGKDSAEEASDGNKKTAAAQDEMKNTRHPSTNDIDATPLKSIEEQTRAHDQHVHEINIDWESPLLDSEIEAAIKSYDRETAASINSHDGAPMTPGVTANAPGDCSHRHQYARDDQRHQHHGDSQQRLYKNNSNNTNNQGLSPDPFHHDPTRSPFALGGQNGNRQSSLKKANPRSKMTSRRFSSNDRVLLRVDRPAIRQEGGVRTREQEDAVEVLAAYYFDEQ